ncbi:MAG TPA: S26 family signal peptidase [Pilimelia sp.]|nr:S26 family signal peptidase [Pilimelia sp.]
MLILLAVLAAVVLAVVVTVRYGLVVVNVLGVSMQPTFADGDRALAVRRRWWRRTARGDVVVCLPPPLPGVQPTGPDRPTHGPPVVKRIVGVAGDEMTVGDRVTAVPAGHVWLRGDGRHTYDSDQYGALPETAVTAVVVGRLPARRARR